MTSPTDFAGEAIVGVASPAPSAVAEVASSADFAGLVDPCGTFGMEYGDSVLAPGDCNGICGDFAEVTSLVELAGGAPVDAVPRAVMDGTAIDGMSHAAQCRNGDESPESVGLTHRLRSHRLLWWVPSARELPGS